MNAFLFLLFSFLFYSPMANAEQTVSYLTDLEGSRLRFEKFLQESGAFELGADGKYHLKEGAQFVYGGDAPDRYFGSRWVVSELVRLKKENPDRVTLILGNRDINKMRLIAELSKLAITKPAVKHSFTKEEEWKKHLGPETRAERLKYIFVHTMGSPNAFELRHQEMAKDLKVDLATVSDDEVVEDFLHELGPDGNFRQLLELGQLAHRIGNTLFIHGGVTKENLGLIPGDPKRRTKIDDWIAGLNQWFQSGVKIWKSRDRDWSGEEPRPEQDWLDYSVPKPGMSSKPESVVTARNSDKYNNPHLPDPEIIAELLAQGIERIVIGHTPTGDYPLILRLADGRFEVISADNSYAKSEDFASLLHFSGEGLKQTSVQGKIALETGATEVFSELTLGTPTPIGQRLNEGLLIGRLQNDPKKIVSFKLEEKFRITTEVLDESKIENTELKEPINCTVQAEIKPPR